MIKISQLKLLILGAWFLHTPMQFCLGGILDKKKLVIDLNSMSLADLENMKEIKHKDPFFFELLTCRHRSLTDVEKAYTSMRQSWTLEGPKIKMRNSDYAAYQFIPDFLYPFFVKQWYESHIPIPKVADVLAHPMFGVISISKVADALAHQGEGCRRFRDLIYVRMEEDTLVRRDLEAAAQRDRETHYQKLLSELGAPVKPEIKK